MEDDKEALCVVRDFSGISHDWKVELLVSASTTGKQFLRDIADRYNFEPDSFRLVSPTPSKKDNIYQVPSAFCTVYYVLHPYEVFIRDMLLGRDHQR